MEITAACCWGCTQALVCLVRLESVKRSSQINSDFLTKNQSGQNGFLYASWWDWGMLYPTRNSNGKLSSQITDRFFKILLQEAKLRDSGRKKSQKSGRIIFLELILLILCKTQIVEHKYHWKDYRYPGNYPFSVVKMKKQIIGEVGLVMWVMWAALITTSKPTTWIKPTIYRIRRGKSSRVFPNYSTQVAANPAKTLL